MGFHFYPLYSFDNYRNLPSSRCSQRVRLGCFSTAIRAIRSSVEPIDPRSELSTSSNAEAAAGISRGREDRLGSPRCKYGRPSRSSLPKSRSKLRGITPNENKTCHKPNGSARRFSIGGKSRLRVSNQQPSITTGNIFTY